MAIRPEDYVDPHLAPAPSEAGCYAIFWALFAAVTLLLIARFTTRWRSHLLFSLEDCTVLLAYTFLLVAGILYTITQPTSFLIRSLRDGSFPIDRLGDPFEWVTTLNSYAEMQFAMKIIFYCCLWTVKLSFLLFLRKLLFALPGYAKYWWAATAFWGVTFVGCILSAFTACPTVGAFSAAVLCGTETDTKANANGLLYVALADVLTDLTIVILPYPLISKLHHLSFKQKVGVYGIFSLCGVTIAACIVRAANVLNGHGKWFDPVWVLLWNNIECLTAVAMATIPGLIQAARKSNASSPLGISLKSDDNNNNNNDHAHQHDQASPGRSATPRPASNQIEQVQQQPKKRPPVLDWWTSALRRPSLRPDEDEVDYEYDEERQIGSKGAISKCNTNGTLP